MEDPADIFAPPAEGSFQPGDPIALNLPETSSKARKRAARGEQPLSLRVLNPTKKTTDPAQAQIITEEREQAAAEAARKAERRAAKEAIKEAQKAAAAKKAANRAAREAAAAERRNAEATAALAQAKAAEYTRAAKEAERAAVRAEAREEEAAEADLPRKTPAPASTTPSSAATMGPESSTAVVAATVPNAQQADDEDAMFENYARRLRQNARLLDQVEPTQNYKGRLAHMDMAFRGMVSAVDKGRAAFAARAERLNSERVAVPQNAPRQGEAQPGALPKIELKVEDVMPAAAPPGARLHRKRERALLAPDVIAAAAGQEAAFLASQKRRREEEKPFLPQGRILPQSQTSIIQTAPQPQQSFSMEAAPPSASIALAVADPTARALTIPSAVAGCDNALDFKPTQWTLLHKCAFETIQQALPNLSPTERSEICESFYNITHKKSGKHTKPKEPKLEALIRLALRAGELEANRMRVVFGEKMRAFRKHRHGLVHHANGGYTEKMTAKARKVGVAVGAPIRTRGWVQRDKGKLKRAIAAEAVGTSQMATPKQKARVEKLRQAEDVQRAMVTVQGLIAAAQAAQ